MLNLQGAEEDFKLTKTLIEIFVIISIIFLSIIIPILLISNSSIYFQGAFARHQEEVNRYAELTEYDYSKFDEILLFMNNQTESLDSEYFSKEDILHMIDVRDLTNMAKALTLICFVFIVSYMVLRYKSEKRTLLLQTLLKKALITLILIGLVVIVFFNYAFISFHQIFFSSNNYWILDPRSSRLIRFLPQSIFLEVFIISFVCALLIILSGQLFAIILNKWKEKRS